MSEPHPSTLSPVRRYEPRWMPELEWGVFDCTTHTWVVPCDGSRSQNDAEAAALELEARKCTYKKRYGSKKLAKGVASRLTRELGEPIEAYHCFICHAHHVGHPTGWRKENGQPRSLSWPSLSPKESA